MEQAQKSRMSRFLPFNCSKAKQNESEIMEGQSSAKEPPPLEKAKYSWPMPSSHGFQAEIGGPCYDVDEERWNSCYKFEETGQIKHREVYYGHSEGSLRVKPQHFHKAAEPHPSQAGLSWEEVKTIIGNASKAVGRLELRECEPTCMTGFILNEDFFLSGASFRTDSVTEMEMKMPGSQLAFVNTDRNAFHHFRVTEGQCGRRFHEAAGKAGRPVHLVLLDKDKNIALYRFDAQRSEDDGEGFVDFSALADMQSMDEADEVAGRRVFAIGYNADLQSKAYHQESMRMLREDILEDLDEHKKERLGYGKNIKMACVQFDHMFKPDRKCLTVGLLQHEPFLEAKGNWVARWQRTISSWVGPAGAMVACMDNKDGTPRLRILGLFYGGKITQRFNDMTAFDAKALQMIADIISPFKGD